MKIGRLELSIMNLARNIQGFSSTMASFKDEIKHLEHPPEVLSEAAAAWSKLSKAEKKALSRKRWKRAIQMTVIGLRLQGTRGVLTSGQTNGRSLLDRMKSVEKEVRVLLSKEGCRIKTANVAHVDPGLPLFAPNTVRNVPRSRDPSQGGSHRQGYIPCSVCNQFLFVLCCDTYPRTVQVDLLLSSKSADKSKARAAKMEGKIPSLEVRSAYLNHRKMSTQRDPASQSNCL